MDLHLRTLLEHASQANRWICSILKAGFDYALLLGSCREFLKPSKDLSLAADPICLDINYLSKKMSPSLPLIIFMALLSIKGMLNFRFEYNRSSFSITQTKQTFGIFSTLLQYQRAMFSSIHYLET